MGTDYQQYCPIAKAMEVLGERWTLLVVREFLVGSRKFNYIARGVPGRSRTMLTKRLLRDPTADECDALLLMWWAHSRLDTSQLPADRRTVMKFHFTDVAERFWVVIEPAGHRSASQIPVLTPTPPSRPRHRYCTRFGMAARPSAIKSQSLRFEGKKAITRRLSGFLSIDPATGLLGPGAVRARPRIYRQNARTLSGADMRQLLHEISGEVEQLFGVGGGITTLNPRPGSKWIPLPTVA